MIAQIACDAMSKGKLLKVQYDGHSRSVEVHAVGVSKAGNDVMLCWQTDGGSISGSNGWKLMKLAKVHATVILDEQSQAPRFGYRRNDPQLARIVCQL